MGLAWALQVKVVVCIREDHISGLPLLPTQSLTRTLKSQLLRCHQRSLKRWIGSCLNKTVLQNYTSWLYNCIYLPNNLVCITVYFLTCHSGRAAMHRDYLETASIKVILMPGKWLFNRPFIPLGWIFCQGWCQWCGSQALGDAASGLPFTGTAAKATLPVFLDSWTDKYWSTDWCLTKSQGHHQMNVSESRSTDYTLQVLFPVIIDLQQKLYPPSSLSFHCNIQCDALQC